MRQCAKCKVKLPGETGEWVLYSYAEGDYSHALLCGKAACESKLQAGAAWSRYVNAEAWIDHRLRQKAQGR